MTKSTRSMRNRKPPLDEAAVEEAVVALGADVVEGEEGLSDEFNNLMSGLSGSLRDKVGKVLEDAALPLDEDISLSSKGPKGNLDYVEPGSLQHLLLLGFDEFGKYLSDLNHLSEERSEQFIATRLRWWYAARSGSEKGEPFPTGCPGAWNPSMDDPDVEEVTS